MSDHAAPPEPRANPDLFGQNAAAAALRDAALGGRPHHAWLITGPEGVGKETLAFRYARWLLAGMPDAAVGQVPLHLDARHPVFSRVASGGHADLKPLAPTVPEGKVRVQIGVDEVRAVPRFLSLTSAEGGWRVVIVDHADWMIGAAQNAVLKTLEEPPPRATLLLLSDAPDRLLPTIRSRCRRLSLPPLQGPDLRGLIARWFSAMPGEEREALARAARGSPGRALRLAEGDGLALARDVEGFLASLPVPDPRGLHALADRIAAKRDGSAFAGFAAMLRDALADAVAGAARGAGRGGGAAPSPPAWLAARPLDEWARLWAELGEVAARTDGLNLDRKEAILGALRGMAGAGRRA